ncbi:AlpA family phage regulatory protein, partial [Escherichia coli]
YAWVQEGKAPQPIRFGSRCSMWRYSDIEAFIAAHTNNEGDCHE